MVCTSWDKLPCYDVGNKTWSEVQMACMEPAYTLCRIPHTTFIILQLVEYSHLSIGAL